ncbi:DUF2971 domain-containing protein [Oceanobacter kriegii]|uniref:DUF2971 domain-containing protein n=1 Tax=Oceanobacter kriegii TaxID=64972 RepID=UPI00041B356E|nr:DUF2971 domain-containing protein [Oceanobacter kriegii]
MLTKYFGLIRETSFPRISFLEDGLFRITQPIFLNDKGSESKILPYFNEFSEVDYDWARKEERKFQRQFGYEPSKSELKSLFLKPHGERFGDSLPHLVQSQYGFSNMTEYDRHTFENLVAQLNDVITQFSSLSLGVFSLAKSSTNEHMWVHYANEGQGIAIEFDDSHAFFQHYKPKDISYQPQDRASLTYYKGQIRLNGVHVKLSSAEHPTDALMLWNEFPKSGVDMADLSDRLLYSKKESWSIEDEARVVIPLSEADKSCGNEHVVSFNFDKREIIKNLGLTYRETYLKKIPFEAFQRLIFGYATTDSTIEKIVQVAQTNPKLAHLSFAKAKHNVFGDIEIEPIS